MSLTPHFSSLTQPLILVALADLLSFAMDADVKNATANNTIRSFFICDLSPCRIIRGKFAFPQFASGSHLQSQGKRKGYSNWTAADSYFFCCEVCCEAPTGAAGRV